MSNDPWKHRSDNMKCKTCIWFVPKVPAACEVNSDKDQPGHFYDLGRCRRHCPTMGGFPVVFVNDWCGDHRLDEEKYRRPDPNVGNVVSAGTFPARGRA